MMAFSVALGCIYSYFCRVVISTPKSKGQRAGAFLLCNRTQPCQPFSFFVPTTPGKVSFIQPLVPAEGVRGTVGSFVTVRRTLPAGAGEEEKSKQRQRFPVLTQTRLMWPLPTTYGALCRLLRLSRGHRNHWLPSPRVPVFIRAST